VRCDAASLGVPCTNCVAFSIECRIPAPKRKKAQKKGTISSSHDGSNDDAPPVPAKRTSIRPDLDNLRQAAAEEQAERMPSQASSGEADAASGYPTFMKPKFARAPIREAGRVAYLGESSNLSLLVHDKHGASDVVHYPLPDDIRGPRARLSDLDNLEIDILHQRGAFLLPPRSLCDELVDAYFNWVAPVVPIINRTRFMRRYRDPKNPPSLLLLQAMLLAGCRVCSNPQLMDAGGSTTPAAMTFYKRAKALYDANYEDDRVTIVQALVLMGWYWEGPEDVTKNVFYWTRVATIVAQGSGMHRSVDSSQLSCTDKRLWKRIWWTLFTRDRSVAVALGRPVLINTDDSDVEMITEDDFIEDEVDTPDGVPVPADYAPDHIHVQFFLQYVKLCEIMGLVLSQQYSVAGKAKRSNAIDLTHSDVALADWLQNCPREMLWDRNRHHFWSALLHSNYYTTLCLLHRAHMPPATAAATATATHPQTAGAGAGAGTATRQTFIGPNGMRVYPSKTIAFQAAAMVTSIVSQLQAHNQLRYTPAFIVYSLFSALIMHVYQMRSSDASTVAACHEKIAVCMQALRDVSHAWLVAKMVHTLFESILGNKAMEEKMQRAAGKRHHHFRQMQRQNGHPQQQQQQTPVPPRQSHSQSAQLRKHPMSAASASTNPYTASSIRLHGQAGATVRPSETTAGVPPIAMATVPAPAGQPVPSSTDPLSRTSTLTSVSPSALTRDQPHPAPAPAVQQQKQPRKRKLSDLNEFGRPGGAAPAPPVSYERSRPQTPVLGVVGSIGNGNGNGNGNESSNGTDSTKIAGGDHDGSGTHHTPETQQAQDKPMQSGGESASASASASADTATVNATAAAAGAPSLTRPTTPFTQPFVFSIPNTPPDFFLVTRNSPNLSQSMWENFQPDQLFPDGAMGGLGFAEDFNFVHANPLPATLHADTDGVGDGGGGAGINGHADTGAGAVVVDPTLNPRPREAGSQTDFSIPGIHEPLQASASTIMSGHMAATEGGNGCDDQAAHAMAAHGLPPAHVNGNAGGMPGQSDSGDAPANDDAWSSSSRGTGGGPIVPLTLNVEDWFQFFGLQGGFDAA
ncbi:Transcriptional activator of fatty acid utilization, partial [Ascosphaera acerosa]